MRGRDQPAFCEFAREPNILLVAQSAAFFVALTVLALGLLYVVAVAPFLAREKTCYFFLELAPKG